MKSKMNQKPVRLIKTIFLIFCTTIVLVALHGNKVSAGTVKELKSGDKVDVTGDGVADKITYKKYYDSNASYYEKIVIKINDKKAYTVKKSFLSVELKYVKISKKETYLNLYASTDNGVVVFSHLLKYDNTAKKFIKVKSFKYGTYDRKIVSASKKKLVVKGKVQPCATGYITFKTVYKKKNGTWKLQSNDFKVTSCDWGKGDNYFVTSKVIKLYKSAKCSGSAYKIKAGKKLKLIKIRPYKNNENGYSYVRYKGYFKYGNKKGWIDLDDYENNYGIFKNVQLAG